MFLEKLFQRYQMFPNRLFCTLNSCLYLNDLINFNKLLLILKIIIYFPVIKNFHHLNSIKGITYYFQTGLSLVKDINSV